MILGIFHLTVNNKNDDDDDDDDDLKEKKMRFIYLYDF